MDKKIILEVEDLKVHFKTDEGMLKAVDGVSFSLEKGRTMGLVGESGCGKSVTSHSILRLTPPNGSLFGSIKFDGRTDIVALGSDSDEIKAMRSRDISMIFQEPMTSFSPLYTMGNQVMEAILMHQKCSKEEARKIAIDMFRKVGISSPDMRIDQYPHEFSGGMRQRVMIAMALSCNPEVLIADEPTTALDVTIQAQVLELMKDLQKTMGMAILFITHDLGVVAEMCDDICVMYLGRVVESGSAEDIFYSPSHPYTQGLLKSIPKIGQKGDEDLSTIEGVVPIPIDMTPQCGFCDRCEQKIEGLCDSYDVPLVEISNGHSVRCFLYEEVLKKHEEAQQ